MNGNSLIIRFSAALLLALAISGPVASADMITQDINFSAFNLGTDTGNGNNIGTQAYNLFNSNLGTLTEVDISLVNVTVTGAVSVMNDSTITQTYTKITLEGDYTVVDNFGHSDLLTIQTNPAITSTPVAPNATWTSNTLTAGPAPTQTTVLTLSGDIAGFISGPSGTGTTTLTLSSSNTQNVKGNGTFTASQSSTGMGDVILTYIYTPVPEPGQTAACMLAFVACVVAGRKYFQKRELSPV